MTAAHLILAHVPSRARVRMALRRASTAGKCRPLAGCRTSTGPSDTWGWGDREGASLYVLEASTTWQLGQSGPSRQEAPTQADRSERSAEPTSPQPHTPRV